MKTMKNFMKCFVAGFVMVLTFFVTNTNVQAETFKDGLQISSNLLNKYGETDIILGDVTNLQQTAATETSITVSWNPVVGAESYYIADTDGKEIYPLDKTQNTSYTITYPQNTIVGVIVYPVFANEELGNPTGIVVSTLPAKISGVGYDEVFAHDKKLQVSWYRSQVADGYEAICYNKKGKVVQKIDVPESESYSFAKINTTFSKTNTQNIYYVVVKGYILINNNTKKVYGAASNKFYAVPQPKLDKKVSLYHVDENYINVKWAKVKGATSYMIYVSTKQNSGYKKVATVKSNSYKITKFKGKTLNIRKTDYYFKIVTVGKFGKKTVKSKSYYLYGRNKK